MNCTECKENRKEVETIPVPVHETQCARLERVIKRLWIALLVVLLLFVGTNAAWIHYESQFVDVSQEVTQDAENGTNNFVGGDLVGEADCQDNKTSS